MTLAILEQNHRAAMSHAADLQKQLGALPKSDPARERLKSELATVVDVRRRLAFAGLGTPLHVACIAKLPPEVVAELESEAEAILAAREQAGKERRAARGEAPTMPPPAESPRNRRGVSRPEVVYTIARGGSASAPAPTLAAVERLPARGQVRGF
jgi:hypothetical protein